MDHADARVCLLEAAGLLDSLRIPFFLMNGTALGAHRDRGFTPTENDVDFGCLQEDLPRAAAFILLDLLARHGYDTECFIQPFTQPRLIVAWKRTVKIDIAGWAKWNGKRFVATPVRHWITEPYCLVHGERMIESCGSTELFGRTFRVPNPVEEYLEREYGDWRTPRDDHVSRSRVYGFLDKESVPLNLLDAVEHAA